jgi:hypothetical protein
MLPVLAAVAASAALVSGPAPVVDLGPASATTTDGARYAAVVRDSALRVYDAATRRRRSFAGNPDCSRLAAHAGAGRFLLVCEDPDDAIVVNVRTGRSRTLHAKPAPDDVLAMHWLGVGSRYAVYEWEYDDCDSLGCYFENHVIDLKTGVETVPGGTCDLDFDTPRRKGRFRCDYGPGPGASVGRVRQNLTLFHPTTLAEHLSSRCDDTCNPRISGGYVSWSESSRRVLRSRPTSGPGHKHVKTWRFHLRPTNAVTRFGKWYMVPMRGHTLVLRR